MEYEQVYRTIPFWLYLKDGDDFCFTAASSKVSVTFLQYQHP
jgi:hypothetical protein